MSAAAKSARPAYTMHKGVVFLGKKRLGTVTPSGVFEVVGPDGKLHRGTVGGLIRAALRHGAPAVPSGQVRINQHRFDVADGVLWLHGQRVGTVTAEGDYSVKLEGEALTGNVNTTFGAVWLHGATKGGPSSRIVVGGRSLMAVDGVVFEAGEAIGWLLADGRFRAVGLEGDFVAGRLEKVAAQPYLRRPSAL